MVASLPKVWHDMGEDKLRRLCCYVDPAKYMVYNPEFNLVHSKAVLDGDSYYELTVKDSSDQERKGFATKTKAGEVLTQ